MYMRMMIPKNLEISGIAYLTSYHTYHKRRIRENDRELRLQSDGRLTEALILGSHNRIMLTMGRPFTVVSENPGLSSFCFTIPIAKG